MTVVVGLLLAVLAMEILLRLHRLGGQGIAFGTSWRPPAPRVLSFKSHPYALYVNEPRREQPYPTNALGYVGAREVTVARQPRSIRVYCVGGSTTACHDPSAGPDSSWPGQLEALLAQRVPGVRIECINAGAAGYTSAESLAEFLFRGIDLRPDLLLVYHNVNDAWTCQMVDGFRSDYSHARVHKPWTVGWINRLPQLPWLASYQLARDWVTRRFGKANSLLYWIANPPWKSIRSFDPRAVEAFERNITNLTAVAARWNCASVLIRWECDWQARRMPNYLERHDQATDLYFALLEANNQALERVARRAERCSFLDLGRFTSSHFSDTIHFTGPGLTEMARRVADGLEPLIHRLAERALAQTGEAPGSCVNAGVAIHARA